MAVLVIKAKTGAPSRLEKLIERAKKATALVEAECDRVLVVYENQEASIYYEGPLAPVRTPEAS
jgi:hypothetical protein